jgi:hypothetical protein
MFRCCAQALALVSALTGCVATPPKGPFVEYHDGLTPITRPVKCEATYALRSADQPAPLTAHHVERGERLGFRREVDGSVSAVAPGQVHPLAPGAYSWVVMGGVPPWWKRLGQEVSPAVPGAIFLAGVTAAFGGLLFLCAKVGGGDDAGDESDSQSSSRPKEHPPAPAPAKTASRVP